jgi:hypothetical protein
MRLLLTGFMVVFLSSCASMGVEPWERDILAKDSMQLVPNFLDNFYDEHI